MYQPANQWGINQNPRLPNENRPNPGDFLGNANQKETKNYYSPANPINNYTTQFPPGSLGTFREFKRKSLPETSCLQPPFKTNDGGNLYQTFPGAPGTTQNRTLSSSLEDINTHVKYPQTSNNPPSSLYSTSGERGSSNRYTTSFRDNPHQYKPQVPQNPLPAPPQQHYVPFPQYSSSAQHSSVPPVPYGSTHQENTTSSNQRPATGLYSNYYSGFPKSSPADNPVDIQSQFHQPWGAKPQNAPDREQNFPTTIPGREYRDMGDRQKTFTHSARNWTEQHTITMAERLNRLSEILYQLIGRIESCNGNTAEARNILDDTSRRVSSREFFVAFTALMKCGKSTAVNAMVRSELLPEDLLPETAEIVSIYHKAHAKEPILFHKNRELARGSRQIHERIKELNYFFRLIGSGEPVPESLASRFDESMRNLNLQSHIPAFGQFGSDDMDFIVMDTPGVNEFNTSIKFSVQELLSRADVLVYVFDITKLSSNDEMGYFSQIIAQRSDIIKSGRAFFLLNKIDMITNSDDRESKIEEATRTIIGFLRNINEDLAIAAKNNIRPVSTKLFVLAQAALTNSLSSSAEADLKHFLFGLHPPAQVDYSDYQVRASIESMIELSRWHTVEKDIVEKLTINAPRIFAVSMVDNIKRVVSSLQQQLIIRIQLITQSHQDCQKCISSLKKAASDARGFVQKTHALTSRAREQLRGVIFPIMQNSEESLRRGIVLPPSGKRYKTLEEAQSEADDAARKTQEHLLHTISLIQAQVCTAVETPISHLRTEIEKLVSHEIRETFLASLRGVLDPRQLADLDRGLDVEDIEWSSAHGISPISVDLNKSSPCTVQIETEQEIPPSYQSITEKPPPVKKKRKKASFDHSIAFVGVGATMGGAVGALAGFIGGAGVASPLTGAIGVAVGTVVGGIVVGGGHYMISTLHKMISHRVKKDYQDYVVEPSRLEVKTIKISEQVYENNVENMHREALDVASKTATALRNMVDSLMDSTMTLLEELMRNRFVSTLERIAGVIQRDLEVRLQKYSNTLRWLEEMQQIEKQLGELQGFLSHDIDHILTNKL